MDILIKKAIKGDSDAFITLINQHELYLYKTAKSILDNDEDIADAIQETIISSYNNISKLKTSSYFKTWITRILINKCNDIFRKNKNIIFIDNYQEKSCEDNIHNKLEFDEAFDMLNNDNKIAIKLYYVDGFNSREISEILNEKENTIKSRLLRAKQQLKILLSNSDKEGTKHG